MRVQVSLLPLLTAASALAFATTTATAATPVRPADSPPAAPAITQPAITQPATASAHGLRVAQSDWAPPSARDEGTIEGESNSTDNALDSFLNNLIGEMRPALGQIGDGLDQISGTVAPLLKELTAQMDDLRNYDPPERLENGDILIRRKADAPPPPEMGPALRHYTTPPEQRGQDPSAPEPGTRPNDTPDRDIPGIGSPGFSGPATDL